jgi:hypothetical protein
LSEESLPYRLELRQHFQHLRYTQYHSRHPPPISRHSLKHHRADDSFFVCRKRLNSHRLPAHYFLFSFFIKLDLSLAPLFL